MTGYAPYNVQSNATQTRNEIINRINRLADQYVTHIEKYPHEQGYTTPMFLQSAHITSMDALPLQGWKMHISANNLEDYERLCTVALPEFDRLGIPFKMVRPERIEGQNATIQQGKSLTIYGPLDYNALSPQLKSILSEQSIQPTSDINIHGRIFARYGRFAPSPIKDHYIVGINTIQEFDPKKFGRYYPSGLSNFNPTSILNFPSNSLNKYYQTLDYKTYLQEYYTMMECDGKKHAFMCIEVPSSESSKAHSIIDNAQNNSYGLSFICKSDSPNTTRILIHKSDLPQCLQTMAKYGMTINRPEWDIKNVYYEIAQGYKDTALKLAQEINQRFNMRCVSVVEVESGKFALKCDTVFTQEAMAMCRKYQLPLKDYAPSKKTGIIKKFISKITGKNIGFAEKDITNEVPTNNETRNYISQER